MTSEGWLLQYDFAIWSVQTRRSAMLGPVGKVAAFSSNRAPNMGRLRSQQLTHWLLYSDYWKQLKIGSLM